MNKKTKSISADISAGTGERAVVARITVGVCDRDGDVLQPSGCVSTNYEKNPVLLFSHNYALLPVGRCVGLRREGDAIVAKFVFAPRPATHPASEEWQPDTLFHLYQCGAMNAFSIGFKVDSARAANKADVEKFGPNTRQVISRWELLETSCVSIPANQEAVAIAVSKGYLTRERAKRMFGVDCDPPKEIHIIAEMPGPAPRRVVCAIIEEPKPKRMGVVQMVKAEILKRRGRLSQD